jgi:hypothetical protein
MAYLDNYYSQFYNASCKQGHKKTPSTPDAIPLYQNMPHQTKFFMQNEYDLLYLQGTPAATLKGGRLVGLLPKS